MKNFLIVSIVLLAAALCTKASAYVGVTEQYGTAPDGTPLHWVVYTPNGKGPWPAVLVIHGGGFKAGGPGSGTACGQDLAQAGYIAFSIEYRLAPPGKLVGQVSSGRYPEQTDDVKMAVRAARSDPRCNGQVGAVGGSAGGSHVAYVATTGTPGDDRIDVGVCLSGPFDFVDFDNAWNPSFLTDVTNYVGVPATDTADLKAASPAFQPGVATAAPLFLIASAQDPMPPAQLPDLVAKLSGNGMTNYQQTIIPGDLHSFDYWSTVSAQAIAFLKENFAPGPHNTQEMVNLSTRIMVKGGDAGLIGGFIITGKTPKDVVLRGLGPSLTDLHVSGALSDPVLDLYDSSGKLIAENDNWQSPAAPEVAAAGLTPTNPNESLIATSLPPGSYTAVLHGAGDASGVGLLELYDLDPASSHMSNISSRGEVSAGEGAMIGGFINGGSQPTTVLVRAIGPSLANYGVQNALPDPMLELHDNDGNLIASNDNWRSTQQQQIIATTIPPQNDKESAIVATLPPGRYTAVVTGAGGATGVALVEVYDIDPQ